MTHFFAHGSELEHATEPINKTGPLIFSAIVAVLLLFGLYKLLIWSKRTKANKSDVIDT